MEEPESEDHNNGLPPEQSLPEEFLPPDLQSSVDVSEGEVALSCNQEPASEICCEESMNKSEMALVKHTMSVTQNASLQISSTSVDQEELYYELSSKSVDKDPKFVLEHSHLSQEQESLLEIDSSDDIEIKRKSDKTHESLPVSEPHSTVPICIVKSPALPPDDASFPDCGLDFRTLSSSLPTKFPSYLTSPLEQRAGRQRVPSGKEDLNSLFSDDDHSQYACATPLDLHLHHSPSKSQLELNYTGGFSVTRCSPASSKASLNFREGRTAEERSALSDSETRRPRTRLRSCPTRGRAKSAALRLESARDAGHGDRTAGHGDRPAGHGDRPAGRAEAAGTESGRHALNYGPESALDDMLSDIRMLSQESESEVEAPGTPEHAPSMADSVRQRRPRVAKRTEKKNGRRRKKKKQDLDEVDDEAGSEVGSEVPAMLTCPVCLDVFYNAFSLRPCGHAFCEPCLRRLAKCSRDAMRTTTCPVCRNPIDSCVRNTELTGLVEFYRAEDYLRRHRLERNNKYMRHPLPSSSPVTFSPKHQLSRIVSRLDRNRLARRRHRTGPTPLRLDLWRFVSLALAFIMLKGFLLVVMLCLYCMVYDQSLHEKLFEISVSGVFALFRYAALLTPKLWGFAGVMLFGVIFVVVLKYSHYGVTWYKPMHENQRMEFN